VAATQPRQQHERWKEPLWQEPADHQPLEYRSANRRPTLSRSRSALGAFYRRLRARIGKEKAITAAAHRLAHMIYFTLKNQRPYIDPGPDHYTQQHRERILKSMEKRARQLGYQLVKAA
jgi:hypothetical protein